MPPRISPSAATRLSGCLFKVQPAANVSTTASTQAGLRTNLTSSLLERTNDRSPASHNQNQNPGNSNAGPAGDTTAAVQDIYASITQRSRFGQGGGGGGNNNNNNIIGNQGYNVEDDLRNQQKAGEYGRQLTRRWRAGDVYSPHDLSGSEMTRWRRRTALQKDFVDALGLKPLDMYRNFSFISEFMTPHGRIMKASETGLRPPNQRKVAKAIRRAVGLGIHPSVHRHPELLMRDSERITAQHMITRQQRDRRGGYMR